MEHVLASKITAWCLRRNSMSETQAIAVTYGIELMFNSLFKIAALVLLGFMFHRVWDVILSIGCFSLLRSCAGGVHMKSGIGCFASMLLMCVLSCAGAEFIGYFPAGILAVLSLGIVILNKMFAPFFTENNPIEDMRIVKSKNTKAVVISVLLLAVMWFVPVWRVKLLILIPLTIETLTILPCWHKGGQRDEEGNVDTEVSTENGKSGN